MAGTPGLLAPERKQKVNEPVWHQRANVRPGIAEPETAYVGRSGERLLARGLPTRPALLHSQEPGSDLMGVSLAVLQRPFADLFGEGVVESAERAETAFHGDVQDVSSGRRQQPLGMGQA